MSKKPLTFEEFQATKVACTCADVVFRERFPSMTIGEYCDLTDKGFTARLIYHGGCYIDQYDRNGVDEYLLQLDSGDYTNIYLKHLETMLYLNHYLPEICDKSSDCHPDYIYIEDGTLGSPDGITITFRGKSTYLDLDTFNFNSGTLRAVQDHIVESIKDVNEPWYDSKITVVNE